MTVGDRIQGSRAERGQLGVSPAFHVDPSRSRTPDAERREILTDPGFGKYFTDHMVTVEWNAELGWHRARVTALRPFSVHPGCVALHYAQSVFEGLKAYRRGDGSIWLFRPDLNARRFRASAKRLALPPLDTALFHQSLVALLQVDGEWVPAGNREASLYLRPFMFGTEQTLGVRPSPTVTYCVIATPAAPYFPGGSTGMRLWVGQHARAWPGGTGTAKYGGNYAATLLAERDAAAHHCDNVLFVDEHGAIQESGNMNVFAVTSDDELITPGLGTILDGVTRNSILTLASEHGLTPVERRIAFDELAAGCSAGRVREVFAVGTAAVVNPIVGFTTRDGDVTVADGAPGPRSAALRDHLLDIQYGYRPDLYGWMVEVPLPNSSATG